MRAPAFVVVLMFASVSVCRGQTPAVISYTAVDLSRTDRRFLSTNPVIAIDESSGCVFNRVRSLVITNKRSIAVANTGNNEVCLFSVNGRLLYRSGRGGSGPGEYRDMTAIHVIPGDSLLVVDNLLRRLSVLNPGGTFVRSMTIVPPVDRLGSITRVLVLRDGSLIVGYSEVTSMKPRADPVFFEQQLFRYDARGNLLGSVGRFTESEHFVQEVARQFGGVAYWDRAFGKRFVMAPFGSGFLGGDGAGPVLQQYDVAGRVTTLHRFPVQNRPVTQRDIEDYRRTALSGARPERRVLVQQMVDRMPYPATMPVFNAVLSDGATRVWVKQYMRSTDREKTWVVLDSATRETAVFAAPRAFDLLAVSLNLACGVWRDELDIESVRCFDISRRT